MGDNKISEAVGAACSAFNATDGMLPSRMHAAIEAALPFILSVDDAQMAESYRLAHAAGEAHGKSIASLDSHLQGEAVPVAYRYKDYQPWLAGGFAWGYCDQKPVDPELVGEPLYTHPQPAELNEVSGGHELARAVEKALGNRDGKRDAELDELLEMAMHELNAIDTSLPDEVCGNSGEFPK